MVMDLPKPPDEPELKNIIDKLANFVARNGPEFENMTKQKQQDNQKFSFLFGGEHYAYYQYKVHAEQAIYNMQNKKLQEHAAQQVQQQQQMGVRVGSQPFVPPLSAPPPIQVSPWVSSAPPLLPTTTVSLVEPPTSQAVVQQPPPQQQQTPQQQQVAQIQQQIQLQQNQIQQQTTLNEQQIKQSEQNLAAQYSSLMQQQQAQIEDAIESQRQEELMRLSDECSIPLEDLHRTVKPIIDSCTKDAILSGKSWIFQHCSTDHQSLLIGKYMLRRILAKEASFELRLHLIYLINDLEQVVVPVFCTSLIGAGEDKKVKLNKLLTLWEQNKYFHPDTIEKMKEPERALSQFHADLITENGPLVTQISSGIQLMYQNLQKQHNDFCSHLQSQLQQLQSQLSQLQTQLAQAQAAAPWTGPPPVSSAGGPGQIPLPDFSKPPPGFPPLGIPRLPPPDIDLTPSVPYYDLPSGLMAPLVKLEDHDYRPLDPRDIRLPPPMPPSDRLSTDQFLAAAAAAKSTDKLGEENKGHMLLKKMGWGGRGLGAKEQGIVNPIEAGEVRDRTDMYKGIGNSQNDPFEQFRKNKSQGFISRMQARDPGAKK
ncbi:CHERP-like protein [Mya arenaria]|uniref:CHERP-like protein n=1 Tax=Mya arenaria TaxID=6604 RepID=A0ABY7FNG7_MYAAR|nr:CHERP-like protein [Mya arenaria]